MLSVIINGKPYSTHRDMNLLEFLRDVLHITSLKNGCAEGACGACTVLLEGKPRRACTLSLGKVNGKSVLTVEGLTEKERQAYSWAFAEAGAVQCGFCIPGMVISAKGLLDRKPNPTPGEIKRALCGNICRCTGYVKIVQAIMLTARILRGEGQPDYQDNSEKTGVMGSRVGDSLNRLDAYKKVLGTAQFADDLHIDGMLYGAVVRSKYPRARIISIHTAEARSCPGVEAVLNAEDIPGERYWGHIFHDWPTLVASGEETRYIGDALALVAARSKAEARAAAEKVLVEYEKLSPLLSPGEAMAKEAYAIHPKGNILSTTRIKRGDATKALAGSAHVVTQFYRTPTSEHGFMEPESSLAIPQENGGILVYVASQSVYDDMRGIAAILKLPEEKVRVVSTYVGGAFGGKEDLSVQHHAALLAQKTGKPVQLTLSRPESFRVHPKRHAMELEVTTGCDEEGRLTGMIARIVADTGAYASLGSAVLQRACTHVSGPYVLPNVDIHGECVYTNNPPAGAYRGFGVPQAAFACESNLDLLVEKVGISPWEIRYRNALEPGKINACGQIMDEGTGLKETLLAVKSAYDSDPRAGLACAMKNTGIGVGLPDIARVRIKIEKRANDPVKAVVYTSAQCMGQGLATIVLQLVVETTGIPPDLIEILQPDTSVTPDAGTTTASRQTLFTGEACRQAALKLGLSLTEFFNSRKSQGAKSDLGEPIASLSATTISEALHALEGREFFGEYSGVTDPLDSTKENPQNHVAYSFATHVVHLNDEGFVEKVVAAHDVGRAINPKAVEGQIEGGVVMGMGFALKEEFPLQEGIPTATLGTLGLLRSTDMPAIDVLLIEKNPSELAFGAKGVGEISSIPITAAVASAYHRRDGKIRTQLPLEDSPYRIHHC